MHLFIDENPNCGMEERVFASRGSARLVTHVLMDDPKLKKEGWCAVVGVNEDGSFAPAQAQQVDDSSDGTAWLIYGGAWGLRFKNENNSSGWDINDSNQWGRPFLVFDSAGKEIRFK